MKMSCVWVVCLSLTGSWLLAAPAQVRPPTVKERGPHHRVIEQIIEERIEDGEDDVIATRVSRVVELATGLHYRRGREGNEWAESQELIEPHPQGAVAHHGQIQCAFQGNLNSRGAIQVVVNPDGGKSPAKFTMHLLGLMATDAANGRSLTVASVKDSVGQIDRALQNRIVFPDAFAGLLKGEVVYVYTRQGIEQFVRILEVEASLATFLADQGLSLETTRLETITEVLEAPGGLIFTEILKAEDDPQRRAAMALPDFLNQRIDFGAVRLPPGKAFDLGGAVANPIAVGTTWEVVGPRTFLIEAVEWSAIQRALEALPQRQANAGKAALPRAFKAQKADPKGANTFALAQADRLALRGVAGRSATGATLARPFPPAPRLRAATDLKPMKKMAMLDWNHGLILDYSLTLNGGLTNWVFRPEVTHKILSNSTVSLYGTNTIMGCTVVKAQRNSVLEFNGTVICDTTPYHPAAFLSADDTTLGDNVASGSLSGYYAAAALRASSNVMGELHDLRISHAQVGIDWTGSADRFYNLQFLNCSNAMRRVNATNAPVHNMLAKSVRSLFIISNASLNVQHLTANAVETLGDFSGNLNTLLLTNIIFVNVTNLGVNGSSKYGDYIGTHNTTLSGTFGISGVSHEFPVGSTNLLFTTVVGGDHYLVTNSSWRNVGTADTISPTLLSELRRLTTFPPVLLTGTAQVDVVFSPIIPRDTESPDLGWHYPSLDFILRGYRLNTNVVAIMTNGVAIGIDYNGQSWGLIFDSATNISVGNPTNMNRIVRAHNVQERSTGNPGTRAMLYDIGNSGTHGNSEARWRFTEFATMVGDGYALYTGKYWKNFEWSHCWLYNLSITFNANNGGQTIGLTNNVCDWADANLQRGGSSSTFHLQNNLFRNYAINVTSLNSSSTVRDTLFDRVLFYTNGTTVTHSHNAYFLCTNGTTYSTNALPGFNNNIGLTNLVYDIDPYARYGPYGRYYQPTNSLILHAGSTTADLVGLYHFTSTTNNVKETNAVVTIGPHWVALDSNGNLVDTDGDGWPDYFENWTGTGSVNSGETDWQNAADLGFQVFITRPRANSAIP